MYQKAVICFSNRSNFCEHHKTGTHFKIMYFLQTQMITYIVLRFIYRFLRKKCEIK